MPNFIGVSGTVCKMTDYAHWHVFVFPCSDMYQNIYLSHLKLEKKTALNELKELEYWKTPSQLSSYAHWHASLYLHAQTHIKIFIYLSHSKLEKKTEPNGLEYSKTLTQMNTYAHKFVFFCICMLKHVSKHSSIENCFCFDFPYFSKIDDAQWYMWTETLTLRKKGGG